METFTIQSFCTLVNLGQTTFLWDFSTTECLNHQAAMGGLRWLIMWSASAHEAQYAAAAHRPAERSPSPPIRMGRDAICSASWSSSAVPWSLTQCHRCPPHARVMCSNILAGELRCADYVVGTWTGESGTRGIASHSRCSVNDPRLQELSQVNCALPMGVPRTLLPSACQTSGPSWCTSRGGTPPRFHTLVFLVQTDACRPARLLRPVRLCVSDPRRPTNFTRKGWRN